MKPTAIAVTIALAIVLGLWLVEDSWLVHIALITALTILALYYFWSGRHPLAFDITAQPDGVYYEFSDEEYGAEFKRPRAKNVGRGVPGTNRSQL